MNFFSKKQIINKSPDKSIGFGEIYSGFDFSINKESPAYDAMLEILQEFFDKESPDLKKMKVAIMDVDSWVDYFNKQQIHENVSTYDKIILILDAENVKSSLNLHYVGLQRGLLRYNDCVLWDNYNYKTLSSIITVVLNKLVEN